MAISYSKGIREFEWTYEKAWNGLSKLHGTAQHHLDSFTGEKAINGHIRGYCFSNGLEKSFKLNYEIVLKNGIPTHLYDMRNERGDRLKDLLALNNELRSRLEMEPLKSNVIQNFQQRIKTEREALRNVQDDKFSSDEKEVNVPLIPKNPENKKVIITNGPSQSEDGILAKGNQTKQIVEIVGDKAIDTAANNVELVQAEDNPPVDDQKEEEEVPVEVIEEAPEEKEEVEVVEEAPEEEEVEVVEEAPEEVEEVPVEEEEEEVPVEVVEEAPEEEEEPKVELDNSDSALVEEVEEDDGVNDAGINDDGDLSVDPDITETETEELNEFD